VEEAKDSASLRSEISRHEPSGLEMRARLGTCSWNGGVRTWQLEAAKELKEGNDDVRVVFDGAGTAWVPELAKKERKAHGLYAAVGDRTAIGSRASAPTARVPSA
jgi:hypothetical protein